MKKFDVVVLGGGPGGYIAALKASRMGANTALIEAHKLGGVCYNYGCIPTKTLLKNAKMYEDILSSQRFGIDIQGNVKIDWDLMIKRKNQVVNDVVLSVETLLHKNNVEILHGYGEVIDKNTIVVSGETVKTDNLIIATGSSVKFPPISGLKESYENGDVLDSTGAMNFKELPKDMIILGAGVIGVEFATLYASLGVNVTLVQRSGEILSNLDFEIRDQIYKNLVDKGVNILLKTSTLSIDGHVVTISSKGETRDISAEAVIACLGRTPNTKSFEKLNLEMIRGSVKVNENMETSIPGVYAIGDVNGKIMLAHVASAEGTVAAENIMGIKSTMNYDMVPSNIYSSPEIGTIGLTEKGAQNKGYSTVTKKGSLRWNGKSLAEGDTSGFVKIVANRDTGKVLGVHIIAPHAADMIPEASALMSMGGTVQNLAKTIHPHPTMSETIMETASDILEML